ncbi:MAG: GGDEF domain-containing protein [Granulosicoccus sp.]
MYLQRLHKLRLGSDSDFRAKATLGVALAALGLLFPIAILNFFHGIIVTGLGSLGIVILLATNVWLVLRGRCHQTLTLFCLVPAGMIFMITVFQYDGIIGSLWCYPSIVACYCMLSERRAWFANLIILSVCLSMVAITLPLKYSLRITATLLALSLFSAILVRVIDTLNEKLQHQLVRDPLTDLLNRLTLKPILEQAIAEQQDGTEATVLAIDIDHFKLINDRFGHDMGDKALVTLSNILRDNLRDGDHAFRTGGEEFLVLLNGSTEKESNIIAERLRREVEVADIIPGETITISIGAAHAVQNESWTAWVKRADDYLYSAKRLGRNRVALSAEVNVVSFNHSTSPRTVNTADF